VCSPINPSTTSQRWIELRVGTSETRVVLFRMDEGLQPGSRFNGSFACDNVERTYEELSARGVPFQGKPEKQPWGTFVIFTIPTAISSSWQQVGSKQAVGITAPASRILFAEQRDAMALLAQPFDLHQLASAIPARGLELDSDVPRTTTVVFADGEPWTNRGRRAWRRGSLPCVSA